MVTEDLLLYVQASFRAAKRMDGVLRQATEMLASDRAKMEDQFTELRDQFVRKLQKYAAEVCDMCVSK